MYKIKYRKINNYTKIFTLLVLITQNAIIPKI